MRQLGSRRVRRWPAVCFGSRYRETAMVLRNRGGDPRVARGCGRQGRDRQRGRQGLLLWGETVRIVQLTPGAGGMYCGNCLRDNALVRELRRLGHDTVMVPLYLPMTLDETDESAGTPTFFGGISVYLEQ